ncbi:hypothetical protein GTH32_13450 [Alteromonas sp. 345S023]|uniref:Prepilin-type N-terminal cleavage/methylation domain-containing protein n=1 Tax=Alteromonas profundi TaxID=2696062 RepID=A0A7X5LMR1_9ALTE|nr:prepilin-type N-terminal cleavage/methylation domain-containing protein [Alteromonas profundi]NDV92181.1 hypothetical protein [Alteromonas profundi]
MTLSKRLCMRHNAGFALTEVLIASVLFITSILILLAFHQTVFNHWKQTLALSKQQDAKRLAVTRTQARNNKHNTQQILSDIARLDPVLPHSDAQTPLPKE